MRIAQVVLCVGVIYAKRESLFIFKVSPNTLTLLAVDNCRTRVLAEREDAFACCLRVAQELQCHILVVLRRFRVGKNLCHLLVVLTAQHKLHIVESLLCKLRKCFFCNFKNSLALKFSSRYTFLCQKAVFSVVLAQLEHWGILKFRNICHIFFYLKVSVYIKRGDRWYPSTILMWHLRRRNFLLPSFRRRILRHRRNRRHCRVRHRASNR